MLRHLDLFSGIGGFALAARMVGGIKTAQFVEIDPYCQKVLMKNFPGIPIHGDITTFTPESGRYELITGGFPCQPHSAAGKRQASKDDRDMWPELVRIIRNVQARWIVLENVIGLLHSESGRFFGGILWDLAQLGFDAEWGVIPATIVGCIHRRRRVFIIAYPNGKRLQGGRAQTLQRIATLQKSQNSRSFADLRERSHLYEPKLQPCLDGVSRDMARAIGNAVVPQVAAIALQRVLELAKEAPF